MPDLHQCEFFLIRWTPDVVKDEFVNVGVVLLEPSTGYADVRFTRDMRRVRCLDASVEPELFEALETEIRMRLQDPEDRTKFLEKVPDWASNALQLTRATACLTDSPQAELARLADIYLESARRAGRRELSGRAVILNRMRESFEQAGTWDLMWKRIPVAQYTHRGDPLRIDCGYRPNGVIRLFHAVSLESDVDTAKVLAFSYPQIREGIARIENAKCELTAIVEDEIDRTDESISFAMDTLERSDIAIAGVGQLGHFAELARRELRV